MRVDETRLTATYMLANRKHGTLYLGSALDLIQRICEHRSDGGSRFVSKYGVNRLVWFQPFMLVADARGRECEMKKWRREWKVNLIERDNPDWGRSLPWACRRDTDALSLASRLSQHPSVFMGPGLGAARQSGNGC